MSITISLPAQVETKLRQQAAAAGTDIAAFVLEALEEKLALLENAANGDTPPEERANLWRQWVASHPLRPDVVLDDSRESIYAGRGE